ncbi:MAG: IS1595 family transposase [Nitrospinae bacterium]|nr:IS1595 family transposase [Nitrospinota bacterium]
MNKTGIIGAKERETGRVKAEVLEDGKGETLKEFVRENITPGATLLTDENRGYVHLGDNYGGEYQHRRVKHSAKEYVDGMAHTNGIESFWSMLKRGSHGTYHKMSEKHLSRYVAEFAGRHNLWPMDTITQMESLAKRFNASGFRGKPLRNRQDIHKNKHFL